MHSSAKPAVSIRGIPVDNGGAAFFGQNTKGISQRIQFRKRKNLSIIRQDPLCIGPTLPDLHQQVVQGIQIRDLLRSGIQLPHPVGPGQKADLIRRDCPCRDRIDTAVIGSTRPLLL